MATLGLGYVPKTGTSDAGANVNPFLPGTGWNVIVAPTDLPKETEFECYQIALDGPFGSALAVLIDGRFYNYVNQGWKNSYDPSQPMLLRAGVSVQFCWNTAATNPPYNQTSNVLPSVTMWLRRVQGIIS